MGPIGAQQVVQQGAQHEAKQIGSRNDARVGTQAETKGTQNAAQQGSLYDALFSSDMFEKAGKQNGAVGAQQGPQGKQNGAVGAQRE